MPGGKSPGPSIKNPRAYEALKKKFGDTPEGKTRAAKISNAAAARSSSRRKITRRR